MLRVRCLLGLMAYFAAFNCAAAADASDGRRKYNNIIMIVLDDLRPALKIYGDKKAVTPHMDRLAEDGSIFTHAYAQQALCAPSRNSMLTSRRPDSLQLYDFYSYWRTSVGNFTTLPQHLKARGYETMSVGKIFHPGRSSNWTDDYPMSWSTKPYHSTAERFMNKPLCTNVDTGHLDKNVICPVQVRFQPLETLPDIDSIRFAKEIIVERQSNERKPLFLAIGLHKPHIPLRFPAQYLDLHELHKFEQPNFNYVPHDLPSVAFNPYTDIRSRADARVLNISFPFGPIPHPFGVRLRQAYYSAVSYVDDLIGDLLTVVDLQHTLIVLTSDHGWSLGEHAEWAKYSNFEVALRVPIIIREPSPGGTRIATARYIDNVVELIDVFPTIVELAGLPPLKQCSSGVHQREDDCVEGRSLVALLRGPQPLNGSVAFSQYPRPSTYPQVDSDRPRLAHIRIMGYSIRTHQFRYTAWIQFDHAAFRKDWNRVYGEELYDHSLDPDEDLNLVSRPELHRIRRMLKRQLRQKFP